MDFRHLIVTCLFSMLRLSFETQKIKKNYAILIKKSSKRHHGYITTKEITSGIPSNLLSCFVMDSQLS